ncbi:MAG TPA: extracellular solute-binding protein [Methylocystis sp.]|nr:extracellular solute-binding protein [Methylocystis sp.]
MTLGVASPIWSRRRFCEAVASSLIFARSGVAAAEEPRESARRDAPESVESHGLSIFGDLAEAPDFKHFAYVDPKAPKGGAIVVEPPPYKNSSFDSLNGYILRGNPVSGLELLFDTLMAGSLDERDALYGLVAHKVAISPDRLTYKFFLRREARFHDGSPLTAHDAAFSLNLLKRDAHPLIAQPLRELESAEAEGDDALVVKLSPGHARELPIVVASQPIFSKRYYETHKFNETTLEPPLGSSAYKIGKLEQGRFIEYERVADYWGRDLPVNVGRNNFERIRYEYYADATVAFEAFKAGALTEHEEFSSLLWSTAYDFPAARDGRVKRVEFPDENASGTQGYFFNTRRPVFKDPRVRRALVYAFDFEWTNRNLFHGLYRRTTSFFENSDMKAEGPPSEAERALLEPYRDKLPPEVFAEPFRPPVSDGSGQDRALFRKAMDLLLAAGCTHKDGITRLPSGEALEFEFLHFSNFYEKITQPYIKNLRLLGVRATERIVDPAQYKRRVDAFDYDVRTERLRIAHSPGEELRQLFGSESAKTEGSLNLSGVSDPNVDALIAKALAARSRAELVTICRALDRVLIAGAYWTPHWYKPSFWIAYWDVLSRPERAPRYDPGVLSTWWFDAEKDRKMNARER